MGNSSQGVKTWATPKASAAATSVPWTAADTASRRAAGRRLVSEPVHEPATAWAVPYTATTSRATAVAPPSDCMATNGTAVVMASMPSLNDIVPMTMLRTAFLLSAGGSGGGPELPGGTGTGSSS